MMHRPRHRSSTVSVCAALTLAVIAAAPLSARQVPPIQDEEARDRWDVAVDLGFNGSSGNTRLTVFTTGFTVKHLQTDRFELEWKSAFRYGESEGDVVARALRSSFSADYRPQDRWSPFVFSLFERDTFRRLDALTNLGGGVKLTFLRSDRAEASFSTAALHQYENFTEPRGATVLDSRTDARWSFRLRASRNLGENVRLENTSFYRPVWDAADDYDIDTLTALEVRLGERIGLKLSHAFRRDSTPPQDVEKNDQIVQVGITVEL